MSALWTALLKLKLIFLDIDGVLNWDGTEDRVAGFYIGIDPEMVAKLNKITDAHPDAKIVISSTWRKPTAFLPEYTDFEGLKRFLAKRGVKGEIVDFTPIQFGFIARGEEIKRWFALQDRSTIGEFVVLDDAMDGMSPGYKPVKNRWQTDEEYADELKDWLEYSMDLRPHHVITSGDGYPGRCICASDISVEGWCTPECEEQKKLMRPGGLQDEHVKLAIDILNGKLIEVPKWELADETE